MAHRVGHRSNPEILGEDIVPLIWQAAGLGATAYANDKLVHPLTSNIAPHGDNLTGKAVDAASTGVTAYLLGEVVRHIDPAIGRLVRRGGMLLAVGKLISIPFPNFAISAKFPDLPFPSLKLGGGGAPAASLPAPETGGKIVALPSATTRLGTGTTGL